MSFLTEVQRGLTGANQGLTTGCSFLDQHIGGLRRGTFIAVGGEPKSGKTAFVDTMFLLNVYALNPNVDVHWYYYSNEITRIEKEAGIVSTVLYRGYGVRLSADYILGRVKTHEGEPVLLTSDEYELVEKAYEEIIVPIFGRYDDNDQQLEEGKVTFIGHRENPTGVYNTIVKALGREGTIHTVQMGEVQAITGYTPNNPDAVRILVIDHIRGLHHENGNTEKKNIDVMSKYIVNLRNLFRLTTVVVGHLNRTNSDINRVKILGEYIYPDADLWKDSGNIAEDANVVLNLFDPMDPKFGLTNHFGTNLDKHRQKDYAYRTAHIVRNRGGMNLIHGGYKFFGDVKDFLHIHTKT